MSGFEWFAFAMLLVEFVSKIIELVLMIQDALLTRRDKERHK